MISQDIDDLYRHRDDTNNLYRWFMLHSIARDEKSLYTSYKIIPIAIDDLYKYNSLLYL